MAIRKEILHPENDDSVDIYPKTSYDQIEDGWKIADDYIEDYLSPNAGGDVQEILTTIKIGSVIYGISGGSAGGLYKHSVDLSIQGNMIFYIHLVFKSEYKYAINGFISLYEAVSANSEIISGYYRIDSGSGVTPPVGSDPWSITEMNLTAQPNTIQIIGSGGPAGSGYNISSSSVISSCIDTVEEL